MRRLPRVGFTNDDPLTCDDCRSVIYTDMQFYVWGRKRLTLCEKCWAKKYGRRMKLIAMKS